MKASVVIPSFNAFERLNYNLLSLSLQNCSKDLFEVIIIDNCSTDKTGELMSKYHDSLNIKSLYLSNNTSRSKARNIGIEAAIGDIIIFSDSDMISERDYIAKHLQAHAEDSDVICGVNWEKIYTFYYRDFIGYLKANFLKIKHLYNLSKPINKISDKSCLIEEQQIISAEYKKFSFTYSFYDYSYQEIINKYGNKLIDYKFPWSFFITNNCSVKKEKLLEAGLFDEGYSGWGCEDLDLGFRLYKKGCKFKKENIESMHQEHPVNFSENGLKNIHYFSEKYNSVDVLLFYFHGLIPIDIYTANELIREVEIIEQIEEYGLVVLVFRELLKVLRDSKYEDLISDIQHIYNLKKLKKKIDNNKEQLSLLYDEIIEKYKCEKLIHVIKLLEKRVFRMKYQAI